MVLAMIVLLGIINGPAPSKPVAPPTSGVWPALLPESPTNDAQRDALLAERDAHRRAAANALDSALNAQPTFELFIDLDRLRRERPEAFATSPLATAAYALAALDLSNARAVMLHGLTIPSPRVRASPSAPPANSPANSPAASPAAELMVLVATFSSRADAPGRVGAKVLTFTSWPADDAGAAGAAFARSLAARPPDAARASALIALRTDQRGPGPATSGSGIVPWAGLAAVLYAATLPDDARNPFRLELVRWNAKHGPDLRRAVNALRPAAIIELSTPATDPASPWRNATDDLALSAIVPLVVEGDAPSSMTRLNTDLARLAEALAPFVELAQPDEAAQAAAPRWRLRPGATPLVVDLRWRCELVGNAPALRIDATLKPRELVPAALR
jgi:hypothetical protein